MDCLSRPNHLLKASGIKVNIGCGKLVRKDWVNIDLYPQPGAYYVNVVDGLPFKARTVIHIHCEHFLEHLSFFDAERFLAECYRVLVPGGSMRIIVPDAEKYITAYCSSDKEFFQKMQGLGGVERPLETPMHFLNQMFRMGGDHHFAWDFETLRATTTAVGFPTVVLSSYGDTLQEYAIDGTDDWRKVESLYANLQK